MGEGFRDSFLRILQEPEHLRGGQCICLGTRARQYEVRSRLGQSEPGYAESDVTDTPVAITNKGKRAEGEHGISCWDAYVYRVRSLIR